MTKLQALRRSEQKWSKIHRGLAIDGSTSDCALCHLYLYNWERGGCNRCPLSQIGHRCIYPDSIYAIWKRHEDKCKHGATEAAALNCKECEELSYKVWELIYDLYMDEKYK